MSYGIRCACESQRFVSLAGAPAIRRLSGLPAPPPPPPPPVSPPEKTCTWPAAPAPATYSLAGRPMRSIRHSSVSAEPVETAMSGMLSFGVARGDRARERERLVGLARCPAGRRR